MTSISSGSEMSEETQLISASDWWLSDATDRGDAPLPPLFDRLRCPSCCCDCDFCGPARGLL